MTTEVVLPKSFYKLLIGRADLNLRGLIRLYEGANMLNLIIKAIEANADELQEALNEATGPVKIESAVEASGALVIWTGALSHDAWVIRGIATGEGIPNGKMEFEAERRGPDLLTVEEGLSLLRELI